MYPFHGDPVIFVTSVIFLCAPRILGSMFADQESRHLGCFKDLIPASQMPYTSYPEMFSVGQCQTYCMLQHFTFASLQEAGYCACADTYGAHGSSVTCTEPCDAQPEVACGGLLASSVFTSCPPGRFGHMCARRSCSCLRQRPCDLKTGRCPLGGCASGWEGKRCHLKVTAIITRTDVQVTSATGNTTTPPAVSIGSDSRNNSASANVSVIISAQKLMTSLGHGDDVTRDETSRAQTFEDVNFRLHAAIIGIISAGIGVIILVLILLIFILSRKKTTERYKMLPTMTLPFPRL